jgi:hypothetical protein
MQRLLISVILTLAVVLGPAAPAAGAASSLAPVASQTNAPGCSPEGLWMVGPDGTGPRPAPGCPPSASGPTPDHSFIARPGVPSHVASTGGPDDYGYTWDDSVPFNWIDATHGTDTGMSGSSNGPHVGLIALPFAFKYYENTYPSVYIAGSGYLGFTNDNYYWSSYGQIPSPATPNNVIAPYWSYFTLSGSGPTGRVFYISGGSTPNRYFAVEWNQVSSSPGSNNYTFEVVLHENGDIVFQYGTMQYGNSWYCGAAGIEDSAGLDGLNYVSCNRAPYQAPSNKAVRFYRPAASARVKITPNYQGQFAHAGETASFSLPMQNIGELGTDTYDITYSSPWAVSLFAADGVTPLTDTNADGNLDTGPVAQGDTAEIVVKVQVPSGAVLGDRSGTNLTVRSSVNTGVSRSAILQTGIPAPFAQVYVDGADYASSLYLVGPSAQAVKKATADYHYGNRVAVAEGSNGNLIYAWDKGRCLNYNCSPSGYVYEVEYAILNQYGELVHAATKLVDNSSALDTTYDFDPAVAVAPDGDIGVTWIHELAHYTGSTYQYNYNVFFAILDSAGNRVSGPTNLTNNGAWFSYGQPGAGVESMNHPAIAATGDNRFVLAWGRYSYAGNGCSNNCYPEEILYAAQATNGVVVRAATLLESVAPGSSDYYYSPALTRLTGNRALFTFAQNGDIKFLVLDSGGNTVKGKTSITAGGGTYNYNPDAAQLSDGDTVVAWTASSNSGSISFAVLDASYSLASGPTTLANPAAATGSDYVSVAADGAGHGVLTWMDYDYSYRRNLYYALVNGSGSILTNPMIFRTGGGSPPSIQSSDIGYGNTSYSTAVAAGVDAWIQAPAMNGAAPGGGGILPIKYGNHGATTATPVTITATLGVSVTYLSDTSGVAPIVSTNTVVWTLPDLAWLDIGQFNISLGIPNSPYGTTFPVDLTINGGTPDANPADNTQHTNLFAAHQLFLPVTER